MFKTNKFLYSVTLIVAYLLLSSSSATANAQTTNLTDELKEKPVLYKGFVVPCSTGTTTLSSKVKNPNLITASIELLDASNYPNGAYPVISTNPTITGTGDLVVAAFDNVGIGRYIIRAIYTNGGVSDTSDTEPVDVVLRPDNPIPVPIIRHVCAESSDKGSINLGTAGGYDKPYTYQWSTGATTPSISNLSPGYYSVSVTGASGCTTLDTICILSRGLDSVQTPFTRHRP